MTRRRLSRRIWAASLAAALWTVSPSAAPEAPQHPAPAARTAALPRVWPEPPEQPRVRFLRSYTRANSVGRRPVLRRLWAIITGGEDQPAIAQPHGLAVARDRLYVADTFGHAVHVFDLRSGGSEQINVDGDSLIGVAVLGASIYVTDSVSGRLLCLDLKGRKRWAIGRPDGLKRPTGIVAADDRLYVVDTLAHQIVGVAPDGRILERFGSKGSEPGQFNFPTNIARDQSGRLFVTDSMNFRVQVLTAAGRALHSFGKLGDGSGDFRSPKGLALDSDGHVYVVEALNDIVQIFSDDGRLLLAFGEAGAGDGQLWLPSGIAIANDVIYVADSANRRVQAFQYLKESR